MLIGAGEYWLVLSGIGECRGMLNGAEFMRSIRVLLGNADWC